LGASYQYIWYYLKYPEERGFETDLTITAPTLELGYRLYILDLLVDLTMKLGYSKLRYFTTNLRSTEIITNTEITLSNYSIEPSINFNFEIGDKFGFQVGYSYQIILTPANDQYEYEEHFMILKVGIGITYNF
jgi:hypothetical protein